MRTLIEETEGTATACRVVDNLGNHRVGVVKEEFIADTNLSCRFNKDIPKAHLGIEFTKKEHLNLGVSLLLSTPKTSREHLGIVEDECITLCEVIHNILTHDELLLAISIKDWLALFVRLVHLDFL